MTTCKISHQNHHDEFAEFPAGCDPDFDDDFGEPIDRVARFDHAVRDYTDHDARTNLVDLLADGLHWAEANSVDFAQALLAAKKHFAAETEKGGRP